MCSAWSRLFFILDMATKILFTLEAQDIGVAKAQDQIRDRQKEINSLIKEAKKTGNPYDQLLGESQKLKREMSGLAEEQRKLNREFKATQVPKDSLAGLRIEYAKLTDQITKLSAAQRNSDFGKALTKNAASIKKEIDGIEQSLGRFTGNVGNYQTAFRGLAGLLGGAGVTLGADAVIEGARSYERLFAILRQGLGSDSAAKEIFSQIKEFARQTPFQLEEVTNSFVKLQQRGFNPTVDQLQVLGDISVSLNKRLDQLVEAILDAQQGEFERLKEFGIKFKKDGDQLKATFKDQTTTIDNTAQAISKYILSLGKVPGVAGSALAVSKTLDGSLSNLADNFQQLFASIGSGGGILQGFVEGINTLVSGINELISTPLSEELRQQQSDFNAMIGVLQDVNTEESVRNSLIATLKQEYPQYLKFVGDDAKGQIDLAATLEYGNSLFEQRILLQATEEQRTKLVQKKIQLENELTKALVDQKAVIDATEEAKGRDNIPLATAPLARTLGVKRVAGLRKSIADITTELSDLTNTANETALRTTGKSLADIEATVNGLFGQKEDTGGGGNTGKLKALAGSLEYLEDQVKDLEDRIQKTPPSSGLMPKLIADLDTAKEKLSKAKQDFLALQYFLRTGKQLAPVQISDSETAPVATDIAELRIDTPQNRSSAKSQAEALKKDLESRLQAIEFPVEVTVSKEDQEAIDKINKEQDEGNKKREEERIARDEKRREQQKAIEEQLTSTALDSAQSLSDSIFQIKENQLQREQDQAFANLDAQEQKALEAAQGNSQEEAKIRAQFEKKRADLEKKFAKQRKENARKEALINIALAVTKALTGAPPPAGLILAGAAAVAGFAQLAIINSQEFWQGGKVKRLKPGPIREKQNAPRTAHGDTVLAYVAPGEMLLNQEQQKRVAAMAGHDIFDRAGVPGASGGAGIQRFAAGGVADFVPQTGLSNYGATSLNVNTTAEFTPDQIAVIGKMVGQYVAAAVGGEVRRGIGEGIGDANRRLERENAMQTQRQG